MRIRRWRLRIGGEGGKGKRGREERKEGKGEEGLGWRRCIGRFGVCDLGSLRVGERGRERDRWLMWLMCCGFIPVMMERTVHGLSFAFQAARRVRLHVAMYV